MFTIAMNIVVNQKRSTDAIAVGAAYLSELGDGCCVIDQWSGGFRLLARV